MLQFVREVSIPILIQKASLEQRGFLFHIAAGFSGNINPFTGMSANLVHIDQWLAQLRQKLQSQIFYPKLPENPVHSASLGGMENGKNKENHSGASCD